MKERTKRRGAIAILAIFGASLFLLILLIGYTGYAKPEDIETSKEEQTAIGA